MRHFGDKSFQAVDCINTNAKWQLRENCTETNCRTNRLARVKNKKLCYCEEHTTSVVLSWCTLWHFWGENLLQANQPLLRNWSRKLLNSMK